MKRILFVDDEPNVIDGLRRMLRKERKDWDMAFAGSATEALGLLEQQPFDVIVTDLQMPGMNGAQLLEKVVDQYPQMVRIVLSGHGDEKSTTRAMRVVHQYISKPTDPEALRLAITRACSTKSIIGDERVRGAIARCDTLPSPPMLYMQLNSAMNSDKSDARQIARLVSQDVALAAKILQLVNSSFFGLGRRVSSIDQTVALLGITRIKALVLTEVILKQFRPPERLKEFACGTFWEHSSMVAELARLISREEGQRDDRPDQAFTAGLLHDIGKLIFASQFQDEYLQVLRESHETGEPLSVVEMRTMGVNHAEVGSYLLALWGLPPRLIEAVTLHHEPSKLEYDGLCAVTAVHVADALAHEAPMSASDFETTAPELDMAYLERIKLAHRLPVWRKLRAAAAGAPSPEVVKV